MGIELGWLTHYYTNKKFGFGRAENGTKFFFHNDNVAESIRVMLNRQVTTPVCVRVELTPTKKGWRARHLRPFGAQFFGSSSIQYMAESPRPVKT